MTVYHGYVLVCSMSITSFNNTNYTTANPLPLTHLPAETGLGSTNYVFASALIGKIGRTFFTPKKKEGASVWQCFGVEMPTLPKTGPPATCATMVPP